MFLDEITNLDIEHLSTLGVADNIHKVLDVRDLTPDTFVIRIERKNLKFKAGQHIQVKLPGHKQFRYYTIYSGANQASIEILVKEIPTGSLTPLLRKIEANDYLEIKNPAGNYILRETDIDTKKYLFIASGTGISPFHSYVLTYPNLKYHLIHGVRHSSEAYDKNCYQAGAVTVCTTADNNSDFNGRLTQYLQNADLSDFNLVYLCGNSNMITDSIDILESKGFKPEQIYVESYF